MRFHHAGPGLYTYDGERGRYKIAACPMTRVRRNKGSRTGWEVYLPVTGASTKVRTLDDARHLIETHDGVADE